ncbi:PepSY domain-containing protein [Erythrobacter sp. SD-21]|uniref:PepSY-associated TM helix domain-containing protein n=1 Tax=Erythrobacter sp. SD-21 TaxID=161528 RepID=UPI000153FE07|nr:PepSY-associated TM helix domain-containing protein [Erythrobacter sp. SD-21]EDL49452.1 PepSY-associated TM helix [Erythrobacter sp. SD-21]
MRLLSLLHRWTGGLVGLVLAVIGLSGTVLLWEDSWILLDGANDAPASSPTELGRAIEVAIETAPGLSRVTFAGEEIGLHQAIYSDGSGAYIAQDGTVIDRWSGNWERPELWLFDLHHYLLMGEVGKTITGVLGLLMLAFTITGAILWWRTRKTFRLRLWPARYTASAIVRHHRDLGVVTSPLLLIVAATGTMMVFPAISSVLLLPIATSDAKRELPTDLASGSENTDWAVVMANAQSAYPSAAARRLMMPAAPGEPIAIRFRQDFEWTPNGRSYAWVAPESGAIVAKDDPAMGNTASAVVEKFYPIHAAKVGGFLWRIAMTFAGLALVLLGLFASWSFWIGKFTSRSPNALSPKTAN